MRHAERAANHCRALLVFEKGHVFSARHARGRSVIRSMSYIPWQSAARSKCRQLDRRLLYAARPPVFPFFHIACQMSLRMQSSAPAKNEHCAEPRSSSVFALCLSPIMPIQPETNGNRPVTDFNKTTAAQPPLQCCAVSTSHPGLTASDSSSAHARLRLLNCAQPGARRSYADHRRK